jgi:hypothetical protein
MATAASVRYPTFTNTNLAVLAPAAGLVGVLEKMCASTIRAVLVSVRVEIVDPIELFVTLRPKDVVDVLAGIEMSVPMTDIAPGTTAERSTLTPVSAPVSVGPPVVNSPMTPAVWSVVANTAREDDELEVPTCVEMPRRACVLPGRIALLLERQFYLYLLEKFLFGLGYEILKNSLLLKESLFLKKSKMLKKEDYLIIRSVWFLTPLLIPKDLPTLLGSVLKEH